MPAPIILGESFFTALRTSGALYVDKTGFVREVLSAPARVMLYPRPRRFGKTLNMTMLQAFFEIGPDRTAMFEGLEIWQDADARKHFQRHPVIKLTFKDVKQGNWPEAKLSIDALLSAEVSRHRVAIADPRVSNDLRERLSGVMDRTGDQSRTLIDLCEVLAIHHGELPLLLIDEYDAAVLQGWDRGFYDEAVDFFRGLLSPGLKDNPFLFKGVLTGVLRIARETMFSGLNNVEVYSLLQNRGAEHFGFTEPEVLALLEAFGRAGEAEEVRRWYNGYRFGDATVYNPISIMSMLAYPERERLPYWLNTSANALVRSLLLEATDLQEGIAVLLEGGAVTTAIDENVALRDLRGENIWGLFLFSGYLRADNVRVVEGAQLADLSVPNLEVRTIWNDTFRKWLDVRAGRLEPLHAALFAGDAEKIQTILSHMLGVHVSYHDVARDQDEAFYHAFVLGLLVTLEKTHAVRSNREAGAGRADVLILPKRPGLPGVVLEFKGRRGKTPLATSARQALKQIQERDYAMELEAAGANPVRRLGIAFSGKDVVVRGERVNEGPRGGVGPGRRLE